MSREALAFLLTLAAALSSATDRRRRKTCRTESESMSRTLGLADGRDRKYTPRIYYTISYDKITAEGRSLPQVGGMGKRGGRRLLTTFIAVVGPCRCGRRPCVVLTKLRLRSVRLVGSTHITHLDTFSCGRSVLLCPPRTEWGVAENPSRQVSYIGVTAPSLLFPS